VTHTAIYFVAYTKDHGIIEVISIRFADSNARSSSAKPLIHRSPIKPGSRRKAPTKGTPEPTLDRDALEALAWIESGMPDSKVGYGPDAPKLTEDQRRQFEWESYVRAPPAMSGSRRTKPAK
jgi:hypothetical protein